MADLARWPALGDGHAHQLQRWKLFGVAGAVTELACQSRMVCQDRMTLLKAALRGVGVVQMPAMMVHELIRMGRLVNVAPGWQPRAGVVHAVFPSRRGVLPSVRALLDFLGKEFAAAAAVTAMEETAQA